MGVEYGQVRKWLNKADVRDVRGASVHPFDQIGRFATRTVDAGPLSTETTASGDWQPSRVRSTPCG